MKLRKTLPFLVYVIALSSFAGPFMFSAVSVILPAIGKELHANAIELSLIEIVYLGAASSFLLPIGRLADVTDKVTIYKWGALMYAISSLVIGFVSYIPLMIGLRFIQGFSSGLLIATSTAILGDIVPKEQLGKAIGINSGAAYLGLSAGPFIAGWVTRLLDWRWVFFIAFIPLMIAWLTARFYLKSNWKPIQRNFDWKGTLLIVATIFSLIFGVVFIKQPHIGIPICIGSLFLGIGFVVVERKSTNPLVDFKKLKENPILPSGFLTQLLMYAGGFSITFLFSLYLQYIKLYSSNVAGEILFVSPVIMVLFSPICGRLVDKYSPKLLVVSGLSLSFVSVLLATQIVATSPIYFILTLLIIQSFGFALFTIPMMTLIMKSVSPQEFGVVSALSAKMRSLGMVVGMIVITICMAVFLGKHQIEEKIDEFIPMMQVAFIVFAVFAFVGILFAIRMKMKPVEKNNENRH